MNNPNSLIGDLIKDTDASKRFKRHDPLIWILSGSIEESAKWLSDRFLDKSIKNAVQILLCTKYYLFGIRTQRLFNIYAKNGSNIGLSELIYIISSQYDDKFKFKFTNYGSKTAKWTRKCQTYCKFIEDVLIAYLNEYHRRKGKTHQLNDIGLYLAHDNPSSKSFPQDKKKIPLIYEPKNIPYVYFKGLKLNENDVWKAHRRFYASKFEDPFLEYQFSKTDIPEWLIPVV